MRSLVSGALEVRQPAWSAAPEPVDPRPRCSECDELLLMRRAGCGRRREICRKPECLRSRFNRWSRAHRRLGILKPLGRAIARELAALIGGAP